MIIFIIFLVVIIIANIIIKFKPRFEYNSEGLFMYYTIRGKLGDGERYLKQLIKI